MPPLPAPTPRVFLLRHGETEWTLSGRFTSTTDLPLTAHGSVQVRSTARLLVGPRKLLSPANIAAVYVSPRVRAQRTAELFFSAAGGGAAGSAVEGGAVEGGAIKGSVFETTSQLAEWDYGAYEGLLTVEIRARRRAAGLDAHQEWDIWQDGCEGGESPHDVAARLDSLIARIRALHAAAMRGGEAADVVLVRVPVMC
ncbi:hypothetical protein MMC17_000751 [Xylographa soralifera]|nr:hypothetical protein [Xylographa soralifera]